MVDFRTCNLNDILEDAKDSQKRTKALKEFAAEGKPSFITIKRFYYLTFYPEMVPKAKEKKPSMWEQIANL